MFNVLEGARWIGRADADICVIGKLPLFDQFEEAKHVSHFKRLTDLSYGYTQQMCVGVASEFAFELRCAKDKPLTIKWMKGVLGK